MDKPFDFSGNGSTDYSTWSGDELARAGNAADEFLRGNHVAIWRTFEQQSAVLARLCAILKQADLTLEQRLVCFARIAEVSEGIQAAAHGFFELGSEPMVARMLVEANLNLG
jgi:hypothetical protein